MTEFEKWQASRKVKTIGYINNSDAYNAGEKAGWKAALEWAVDQIQGDANGYFNMRRELME